MWPKKQVKQGKTQIVMPPSCWFDFFNMDHFKQLSSVVIITFFSPLGNEASSWIVCWWAFELKFYYLKVPVFLQRHKIPRSIVCEGPNCVPLLWDLQNVFDIIYTSYIIWNEIKLCIIFHHQLSTEEVRIEVYLFICYCHY